MLDAAQDVRVRRELVALLYEDLPWATCAGACLVPVMALLRWLSGGTVWLFAWAFVQLSLHVLAGLLVVAFRCYRQAASTEVWLRRATWLHTAVFALWGIGFAAFIARHDPRVTALGVAVGSYVGAFMLTAVFPTPYAGAIHSALLLLPTALRCAWLGGYLYNSLALLIVLNLLSTAPRSRRLHEVFVRSVALRLQNEDLAARLACAKERAEQALLTRARFVAAASHDLRQPLHAMGLFIELLTAEPLAERARVFVARVRSATETVTSLLQSLLDLSCIDAQAIPIERRAVQLDVLFKELAQQVEPELRGIGLRLQVVPSGACVDSDPVQLARILRNLLSNAIRYSERGTIRLEARVWASEVEIQVCDEGPGIPPDAHEKIFEEFYQLPGSESRQRGGLGLGLAIVQGLTRLLGHRTELRSRVGVDSGTCFSVFVPKTTAPRDSRTLQPAYNLLAGRSALVIDDQTEVREAMAELLRSWQCSVQCAASLPEALALVERHGAPDVMICDYHLADSQTGLDVLAALDDAPATLWVTGDTTPECMQQLRATKHPVLLKPVSPSKLRAAVNALVAPCDARSALPAEAVDIVRVR